MQRYMNIRRIDRIRRASKVLTYGGLAVMVVALVISFGQARDLGTALGLSLIGLLSSQLGTVMMRRWPDRGRSDQVLDAALKGLDGRHAVFHYLLGCRHALFTPRGSALLFPVGEPGMFEWRGAELWRTPLKQGVPSGRPAPMRSTTAHAAQEVTALQEDLSRRIPGRQAWDITPILVFVHPEARVESEGPMAAVHLKKLKEFIRHLPRHAPLSDAELGSLAARFERFRVSA